MRLETGVVQEEGDWPGVFIRGDNAFAYAGQLRAALSMMPKGDDINSVLARNALAGLANLLSSCNTANKPEPQMIARVVQG